jgi:hypothetical protein
MICYWDGVRFIDRMLITDAWSVSGILVMDVLSINPLNAELNPIRHLLALVGARHIVHVSRIRVNRTMMYVWSIIRMLIMDE